MTPSTVRGRAEPPATTRGSQLFALEPVRALLDQWRSDLVSLKQRAPNSDALPCLAECAEQLAGAIAVAGALPMELTLAEAHAVSRVSLRQLQRLCLTTPSLLGARRRGRKWYVDRAAFEVYRTSTMTNGDLFVTAR
jgi:hypothetical protein